VLASPNPAGLRLPPETTKRFVSRRINMDAKTLLALLVVPLIFFFFGMPYVAARQRRRRLSNEEKMSDDQKRLDASN
jgi:hypothetical protein